MSLTNRQEKKNAKTYSRAAARRLYIAEKWLPAEASLLLDYSSSIIGKKVLEVGAGSGRLTAVLKHRAASYCATDINQDMISTLRSVHPDTEAMVADVRRLVMIPSESYDTVIFSFNGIDSLPYADRPRALAEIYRVLRRDGVFIHSTHNVAHAQSASYEPRVEVFLRSIGEYFRRKLNRRELKKLEYYSAEYAVVNDRALENGLVNVYIDPQVHRTHLVISGFGMEAIYERDGRKLSPDEMPRDQWYYVVARKNVCSG